MTHNSTHPINRTLPGRLLRNLPMMIVGVGIMMAGITRLQQVFNWQNDIILSITEGVGNFSAIFLGIFIEAAPFLLMGTLASGLVEVLFSPVELNRLLPHNRFLAVGLGGVLGLFFPVCECGSIPLARRLMSKGIPVPVGIAFLLAAPVINPIVIASTYAAFGNSLIFWLRFALTLFIAIGVGLLFLFEPDRSRILRPASPGTIQSFDLHHDHEGNHPPQPFKEKIKKVMVIAADEFFEMGRFLVIGALLAALMQTVVPQNWLLSLGQGPVLSTIVLSLVAVLLSVCSTVDSFIALAFSSTFSTGALLAFLVYGPMVDIKATLMYLRVFRRPIVAVLVLLPWLLTLIAGVAINVWVR
ncbi:MAG: permease [Bellilinea sp.]|nr:permease [Bellilinea sp.]